MDKTASRKKKAKVLRIFPKVHRITSSTLFLFFFIVAITALLLGWKKNTGDLLGSKTYTGSSTELKEWLSLDELYNSARLHLNDSLELGPTLELDRIDVRQNKGSVKFIFEDYYGVQLNGATGELLHLDRRRADFIENLHDASVLDYYLNTGNYIKLAYTTVMSIALLLFTITGFWLWYGPKRMRSTN